MPSFFLWPVLGTPAVWWLCGGLSVFMMAVLGCTGFRSRFGTVQGLLSACWLAAWITLLVASASAALMAMLGLRASVPVAAGCSAATIGMALAWATRSHGRRLRAQGAEAAWLASSVDWERGRLIDDAPDMGMTPSVWRSPWWVAALAANLPWVWRAWGVADTSVMPWVGLVIVSAAAWLMTSSIGPLLARTLYLRRLEAERGVTLVHAGLPALQALRRSVWLARALVPPDPPQLSDKPGRAAPARSAARR